jgi:thiol-disulfide isomerase/thioredoxin
LAHNSPVDYDTNPEACPKCAFGPLNHAESCPRCGVLVSKYQSLVEATVGQGKGKVLVYAKPTYSWLGYALAACCLVALVVVLVVWIKASSADLQIRPDSPLLNPPDSQEAPLDAPRDAPPAESQAEEEAPAASQTDESVEQVPPADAPQPARKRPPAPVAYFASTWYEGAAGFDRARRDQADYKVPLAVLFFTDWCPNCKRLDREVLGSVEASSYLSGIAKVKVNPERGVLESSLADEFGVKGYPAVFLARPGSRTFTKIAVPSGWDDTTGRSPAKLFVERCKKAAGAR